MTIRFSKMHGAGNDYVYVDCFGQPAPPDPAALARAVSDRHRGIGSDGLILIEPSAVADARMRMWNADGSTAEMCGNGIRCVARYLYEHGLARQENLSVETAAGVKLLSLIVAHGEVQSVQVSMGHPEIGPVLELPLERSRWPGSRSSAGSRASGAVAGGPATTVTVHCVSMGNPHAVVFVDELADEWVLGRGPQIERHAAFPAGVNVEFVQVCSPREISLRVWERGSGETLACGTGACASVVAGVLAEKCGRVAACRLPGGTLEVEWSEQGDVFLSGPAVEVFHGEWP
jgi:diaminopimelate epimerase